MLENLEVRNFRGFKGLKVENLGRINLVVGKNNSGKTSLLEALFLLSSHGHPGVGLNANIVREFSPDITSSEAIRDVLWKPMFFDLDIEGTIEITSDHSSLGHLSMKLFIERLGIAEVADMTSEASGAPAITVVPESLGLSFTGSQGTHHKARITVSDKINLQSEPPWIDASFYTNFISPSNIGRNEDAVKLGGLRKQKRGHILLQALQILEPRLKSIEDNSSSGSPLILGDIGLPELVPLSSMGEGMTRVAHIVLGLARAEMRGGILLVDDIDDGIHHSVLPDVWKVIARTAKDLDVQVFATTHSYECVRDAHEALGPNDFVLHRLEANEDGNRCVTYTPTSIAAAIEHNLEVR